MAEKPDNSPQMNRLRKDWTQGPILRNLLLLSWPMIVMETLFVISQVVDMVWIGRLGGAAVAGAGIANIIFMLVTSIDFGIIMGVRALVARYIGAGDIQGARRVAGQALTIGIVWGAIVTVPGFIFAPQLIGMFGLAPEVVEQGTAYMRVMFCGWVAMEILLMGLYIMQSTGDTLNPMKLELIIRIVHVALCPFLVLGLWFFPRLEIAGAALSNLISQVLGAGIAMWLLFGGRTRIRLSLSDFQINLNLISRIFRIGIPALVMNLQRSFGNVLLTWFIAPFGTTAVAAHSIAARIEMFIYMPTMGLGSGAGVLVGQNLGAQKPERAEKSAWLALGIVQIFMLFCGVLLLVFANNIISIFTTDPELVRIGAAFLRIATAAYIVMALTTVLQNCISSAGDTLPNMIISIVTIWAIQLPLAWAIPHFSTLGVYGIRWAMVIASVASALITLAYFRTGRWKSKRV
ncbi:MAG TPA: MATE family efflux transporter [Dehalococcoidales bacterium]|nr:MATE family efflux transporter [Dehalococcoidales bacterium]